MLALRRLIVSKCLRSNDLAFISGQSILYQHHLVGRSIESIQAGRIDICLGVSRASFSRRSASIPNDIADLPLTPYKHSESVQLSLSWTLRPWQEQADTFVSMVVVVSKGF